MNKQDIIDSIENFNTVVKYCYENDIMVVIHLISSSDTIEINLSPVKEIQIADLK